MDKGRFPAGEERVYVIAEAEINHNGDVATACAMIDAAKDAGADAVKFQYIIADEIASKDSPYYELFKKVELDFEAFTTIRDHAEAAGLDFFITVPSLNAVAPVVSLRPKFLKIGSTNITNLQLLEAVGKAGVPVILSTGLATIGEIETALEALGDAQVALLHCTVSYPAPMDSLNLNALRTMAAAFPDNVVGFSDHSEGAAAAAASVALGARIIEKHFTLDREQEGPDHHFSIDPEGLAELVAAVRGVEAALGTGVKGPSALEMPMVAGARRYLVAAGELAAGTVLAEADFDCRRIQYVQGAVPASDYRLVPGLRLTKGLAAGEAMTWDHFKG